MPKQMTSDAALQNMLDRVGAEDVTPASGSTFRAVLNTPYTALALVDGAEVGSELPSLLALTTDANNLSKGDSLTVDSTSYTVAEKQRQDGDGALTLITLHKA